MASAKKIIQNLFPNLGVADFRVTSPSATNYNCIAWAAGAQNNFWWPTIGYYWPPLAPRAESLTAFIAAYQTVGFVVSQDGTPKAGFEKIAIYLDAAGKPTHAARLLADGKWTSKLGNYHDISHKTVHGLHGARYGTVGQYMERKINDLSDTKS